MPWHIGKHAECSTFAVIKDDDDSLAGCHDTKEEAEAQMAALYANEDVEEAATTKKRLQALARDLNAILGDRSIPAALRKEIEDVRTALRRTWADLGTEADGEKEEPEMENETQGTVEQTPIGQARGLIEQALAILSNLQEAEPNMSPVAESNGAATLTETATGHVIGIEEKQVDSGKLTPLTLDIAVIEPGPGNARDGHYYPRDVLRRDAGVFKGAKMYASDHRENEKSVGTWVSTVKACPVGFTESGAPIARVVVHKDWFARDILSLREAGMLDRMECSILGSGKAKKGKVGEIEYNVVEAITSADSVDWVTRAGAGGRALALAESDAPPLQTEATVDETQEQEQIVQEAETVTLREEDQTGEQPQESPQEPEKTEEPQATTEEPEPAEAALSAGAVSELLKESGLADDAQRLLSVGAYTNEQAVRDAIAEFKRIIKKASGSGQPFAQGASQPAQQTQLTEADRARRYADIKRRYGLDYPLAEVK